MRNFWLVSAAAATALAGAVNPAMAQRFGGQQGGGQPVGSFQQSCRNIQIFPNSLSAECADAQGRFRTSTLDFSRCQGDIGNQNGMLACNGAVASGGAYVPDNNNRNNNRGGTGAAVGAGIGGLAAGALLGGLFQNRQGVDLYAQGYQQYPNFGDQRYGDPRFDPRFAEGGWGYNRRGWVPISERIRWLNERIERGIDRGFISRQEARRLDRQMSDLENRERDYMRSGMDRRRGLSQQEQRDLDRRFDELSYNVRLAMNDRGNDRFRDDRRRF